MCSCWLAVVTCLDEPLLTLGVKPVQQGQMWAFLILQILPFINPCFWAFSRLLNNSVVDSIGLYINPMLWLLKLMYNDCVLQSRSSVLFFLIVLRWLLIMLLSVLGDLLPFNRKQCFDDFWLVAQPSCLLWYQNSWIALFPVFPFPFIFLGPVVMYGVTQLWKVKLINSSVLLEVLYIYLTDVYFTNSDFSF